MNVVSEVPRKSNKRKTLQYLPRQVRKVVALKAVNESGKLKVATP